MQYFPPLRVGERFRLHADCVPPGEQSPAFEVIRVSPCAATVRSLGQRHVEIQNSEGVVVAAFSRSGRPFQISPYSSVVRMSPDPAEEAQP
jgi:hypothetical protein